LGLGTSLQDLLEHGWNGILSGHYTGAGQALRVIGDFSDYIIAAAVSDDGAHIILGDGKKWDRGQAVKAILESLPESTRTSWDHQRRDYVDDVQASAHVSSFLIKLSIHYRRGEYQLGLDFNQRPRGIWPSLI
jgi:hypothetical protein